MKKIKFIAGIIIGIFSLIESAIIAGLDIGNYELSHSYGGDAYTGIQNASAQAANNIISLASIVRNGFSAVLLVFGITMVVMFALKLIEVIKEEKKEKSPKNDGEYSFIQPQPVTPVPSANESESDDLTEKPETLL